MMRLWISLARSRYLALPGSCAQDAIALASASVEKAAMRWKCFMVLSLVVLERPGKRCSLFHYEVCQVLFVLETDVVQQIGIELENLVQLNGPRLGICLGVVHGDFDFQMAVVRAAYAFCHFGGIRDRITGGIEPDPVSKAGGLYYQGVAFPLPGRVAHP